MIELAMSYLGPLLAILGALGVTGILAYTKGKDRAQARAEAQREADRQHLAEQRVAAAQAGANKQVKVTGDALNAQTETNRLDDDAVAARLRDNWTRPE